MSTLSPALSMVGLDVLMIIHTAWVVSSSPGATGRPTMVATVLLGWLAALHWGLSSGGLFPADISGPTFLAVIFGTVGMIGGLLWSSPAARRMLGELDQSRLMLLQGVRVFYGATFLAQAGLGVLPLEFGILDGFTHASAGFLGLVAAYSLAAGIDGERRAWFANIFGIADILIVATSLALVLLPRIGPHHSMMYAVFLPAPLWFWFHVISIWRLLRPARPIPLPALD